MAYYFVPNLERQGSRNPQDFKCVIHAVSHMRSPIKAHQQKHQPAAMDFQLICVQNSYCTEHILQYEQFLHSTLKLTLNTLHLSAFMVSSGCMVITYNL